MAFSISITLFLFFIFIFSAALQYSQSEPSVSNPGDCDGRWIHIRNLPSRFNVDLLAHCSDYPIYGDFCRYLANHGLGPRTFNGSHSWYRTHPHMLELIFHRRMLEYTCLAPDPARAEAIYLPYYAGIDALRYLYGPDLATSADHGRDLYGFLRGERPEVWERSGGRDHFLAMARPAWDFSRRPEAGSPAWGTSFLQLPELENLTALTLEARAWPWQEHAVPHPTTFHPASRRRLESWLDRARRARRTNLMLFADDGGGGGRRIRSECEEEGESRCEVVDCSRGACDGDPVRYMRPMLRSRFCLQPPGETPVRRSTFDGMVAGCIPVFFEEMAAAAQFGWHMEEEEYGEFSVLVRKEEEEEEGRRRKKRVAEVLSGITRAEERRMRERVLKMVGRVTYRRHGSSVGLRSTKDAFDLAVEGTLRRIKERLGGEIIQ